MRDFRQLEWDETLQDDCRQLIRLGVREDLDRVYDLTTLALVPADRVGSVQVVARQEGVVAGGPVVDLMVDEMQLSVQWTKRIEDGARVRSGESIGSLQGSVRDLLTTERLLLNFVGRLSGIATLTDRYVRAVEGTSARIYDTRKTTPGWRRLEKYAVRCGGGRNHRTGLFDAVLIKDNHLAQAATAADPLDPAAAVRQARDFLAEVAPQAGNETLLEIEVDTLEQLESVLREDPDIVLLDNMTLDELRTAVARRNAVAADIQLEASGGITLADLPQIAATGVDRISIGALTHSAISLDVGLDWS